ncbi:MlaD family protein [Sneathiella litorea]|uniref:MCE family protein n=1 Tax=Sneathiella litorea TaxID=2606216 RepID=A0A6L8WBT0_9PROT|nr:MlaD family protein [Sneathiella litorea]MZR31577.1 MCE family protein [Sneathiella litorea]
MELKAKHILVGSFVLISTLSLFAFVAWLAKVEFDQETTFYEIYFENSVSGLSLAADVRYRGINVGSVKHISIDPENPERIRVLVETDAAVPLRNGDHARLELQGITGVSYINIDGAQAGAEVLIADRGRQYPVIPSEPSQLEKLTLGAPDLIASSKELADRASNILNSDNQRLAAEILADVARVMASISSRTDKIENIIDSLDRTSADVVESARLIRQIANETKPLVQDLEASLSVAHGTLADVDNLIENDGKAAVMEFRDFLAESRKLVAIMTRITDRIENDPSGFLFGERDAEFKAK